MKFGRPILRKISGFVATRCRILRPKCTKFNFGADFTGGAYSSAPDPELNLRGLILKEGRGMGMEWEMKGQKRVEGWMGKDRELRIGRGPPRVGFHPHAWNLDKYPAHSQCVGVRSWNSMSKHLHFFTLLDDNSVTRRPSCSCTFQKVKELLPEPEKWEGDHFLEGAATWRPRSDWRRELSSKSVKNASAWT